MIARIGDLVAAAIIPAAIALGAWRLDRSDRRRAAAAPKSGGGS